MDGILHYEAADKLLHELSNKSAVHKDSLRNSIMGRGDVIDLPQYSRNIAFLIENSIVQYTGLNNVYVKMTIKGYEILSNGGVKKYVEEERKKSLKRIKKEEDEDKLRKLNLFNARRQKFTFYISIIALFISASLAYIKIAETFKLWPYNL